MDTRPWLTMLHGFSQHSGQFGAQEQQFSSGYRVFRPELLGHGRNTCEAGPFGIHEYASDILTQLGSRGVDRTHFWGTHTGAAVGLLLARDHPSFIASLILEAPVIPGVTLPIVQTQMDLARETARARGMASAMEQWFETAPWFAVMRANPGPYRCEEQRQMILDFRGAPLLAEHSPPPIDGVPDSLGSIQQPCLIYNGALDSADFLECSALLAAALPNARRLTFDQLGGFPAWEDPRAVRAVVEQFLSRDQPPLVSRCMVR